MTQIDPGLAASSKRAIQRVGQSVTFERITGFAPNVRTIRATVTAALHGKAPDTAEPRASGYGSSQPGGLSETERELLVMVSDLAAVGFPLPLQRGDKMTIAATSERLSVLRFDAGRRAIAGVIEITAAGVA